MPDQIKILIADDDRVFSKLASDILLKEGYCVQQANDVGTALGLLRNTQFHVMMLDMCLPTLNDGFGLLDEVRENYPETTILMISGSGHIPDAVNAIKNGAFDFIEKPITPEHLRLRIKNISAYIRSRSATVEMAKTAIGMVGDSLAMQNVYASIIRSAEYEAPVLITGETGVGKELAAHAIHRLSKFKDKAMVCINCASIPKELFESELFGYEQGAFTGAAKNRKGYFEHADNNTIFLDEVSELPLEVQAKLLRVISEGEIQKVGGKIQNVKTRIVAATNRDLNDMQKQNIFRSDLYYRLNAINIHIPPLRERKDDIIQLASYFCTEFCNHNNIAPLAISFQAMQWLYEQEWHGNARELRSTIERGVIFAKNDHLTVGDLQAGMNNIFATPENQSYTLKQALRSFERSYLQHCLNLHHGNVTRAAQALGIDKSNLFKKISHYTLTTKPEEPGSSKA